MTEAIMKFETVPFMGRYVNATADESHYVALKPLVESIGLKWESIRQLLNRSILGAVACMVQATGNDGKTYQMVCLPLDKLEGFLFLINPNNYDGEVKQRLIAYQLECFKALHDYFTQGVAVNPYANMSKAELMRKCADEIEAKERAEAKVKELVKRNDDLVLQDLNKNALIQQQKTVINNFAPIGPQPEGTYKRRGSWVNMPKKKPSTPCDMLPIEEPPPYTTEHPTVVPNPESQVVVERNDGQKRQKV